MKLVVRQQGHDPTADDAVERLTVRYRTAFAVYQRLVDEHTQLCLSGGKPSQSAQTEEERAFDELDSARFALLGAAALAYPTIH